MPESYSKPCQIFKVMRHIENPGIATTVSRSSHRRCSITKGVLKNFTKFTGKHLYQSLFFNEVASGLKNRPQKHLFYGAPLDDCFRVSGIFRHIYGQSAILSHVKAY